MSKPESFDEKTDSMMYYAFRYCLGRASYVVTDCASYLIANWERLSPWCRTRIHQDIKRAFDANEYGHDDDRAEWQRVLDTPLR